MNNKDIIVAVLTVLSGLGVFLYGLKVMSDSLETAAGNKLSGVLSKISGNRFTGVAIGAGATAIIQSSSATTVMVVGLVNAGIMTLFQATSIIMGANIGTTITAQIAALQYLPISPIIASFSFFGVFMAMFKNSKLKKIGIVLVGLGMIFVGLSLMSSSMKIFRKAPFFTNMLANAKNPILLLFIGLVITVIIQSSSATSVIIISMISADLMNVKQASFAILGVNIGTCITAILASIGSNTNAKRASFIHVLFNILGSLIFLPILAFTPIMANLDARFSEHTTTVAMFHLIFNICTTFILLPFVTPIVKLSKLFIKEKQITKEREKYELKFNHIDKLLIETPTIASNLTRKEIREMADLAMENLELSLELITDTSKRDLEDNFPAREKKINYLNLEIAKFIVELNNRDIPYEDRVILSTYYHVISDIERVGDYAENILEYSQTLVEQKRQFSQDAIKDLKDMFSHVELLFEDAMFCFDNKTTIKMTAINRQEDIVDSYYNRLYKKHVEKLHEKTCSPENSAMFLNVISHLERIADHIRNIAISIKDYHVN